MSGFPAPDEAPPQETLTPLEVCELWARAFADARPQAAHDAHIRAHALRNPGDQRAQRLLLNRRRWLRDQLRRVAGIPAMPSRPSRDTHGRFASSRNGHTRRNGHQRRKPTRAKGRRQPAPASDDEPPPPPRPCRCDHCLPLPDDWFGPAWVRCLLCGHDVEGVAS
jgi:hypothetical protein